MGCVLSNYVPNSTSVNRLIAVRSATVSFLCILPFSFWDGIISTFSVRITTKYSPKCQTRADKKSPFRIRLNSILRAGRTKSARWLSFKFRKMLLVKANELYANLFHLLALCFFFWRNFFVHIELCKGVDKFTCDCPTVHLVCPYFSGYDY